MIGMRNKTLRVSLIIAVVLLGSACGNSNQRDQSTKNGKLRVVVTTTFIGNVVENIAGDRADISWLLTPGQNPHSYQPSPMDMVAVSEADLILANGFGLEEFLEDLLSGSNTEAEVIVVSEGITPLMMEKGHEDSDDHDEDDPMDAVMGLDPHVWFVPENVLVWSDNIANALAKADPENKEYYQENLRRYREQLFELEAWIQEQIDLIPVDQRELVTDHSTLGYFADEYNFEQIGAVIPALTTEAETSGMELAELIDMIREHQARAIFIGVDFDPNLAQRVADETEVELVPLYLGSLSDGAPAGTYLTFMRYNVSAIVEALQ